MLSLHRIAGEASVPVLGRIGARRVATPTMAAGGIGRRVSTTGSVGRARPRRWLDGDVTAPEDPRAELLRLRDSIDNLDAALVHLLAERFKCTEQVGRLKARAGFPPADPDREAVQIERLRRLSVESGLDPVFAEKILGVIIAEVIGNHEAFALEE